MKHTLSNEQWSPVIQNLLHCKEVFQDVYVLGRPCCGGRDASLCVFSGNLVIIFGITCRRETNELQDVFLILRQGVSSQVVRRSKEHAQEQHLPANGNIDVTRCLGSVVASDLEEQPNAGDSTHSNKENDVPAGKPGHYRQVPRVIRQKIM